MEATPLIAETLFACAKGAEVLGSLGHDVGVELEDHSRRRTYYSSKGQSWSGFGFRKKEGKEFILPSFTVRSK